jgi:hypothetical protein
MLHLLNDLHEITIARMINTYIQGCSRKTLQGNAAY